jgi:phage terminase large subunit
MELVITNVFERNFFSTGKIVINRGGTRAGKTYSICQMLVNWLLTGVIRDNLALETGVASVVRKTLPALKATALKDFEEILANTGYYNLVKINKTDREYKYKGRVVEFFSVDNPQKIRGRKRNILYCNEGNELDYKTDFFQLLIRTKNLILIDFNPSDPYIWIKEELEDKRAAERKDTETIITTYLDNPYLSKEEVAEIESIKDQALRKVYVKGEYGIVEGIIFPDITVIDELPKNLNKIAIGLDFGFTNDPTAALVCGVKGDNLYIDEVLYSYGLTNLDIAKELKSLKLEIFADAAEPKSIEEIKRAGLRIKPAKKGSDSIRAGINLLKNYNLHITSRSKGILREQKKYKYKEEGGKATNKPIDKFNHAFDALRYYASIKLTKPESNILAFG